MTKYNNPFEGGGGFAHLPLAKVDAMKGALLCSAAIPGQARRWEIVPIDTPVVLDYGFRQHGWITFSPSVSELVVLDGMTPPDKPQDGRDWQPIAKLPTLIGGRGLFMLSLISKIQLNCIGPLLQLFGLQSEAQQGLLQQYKLSPFEPVSLPQWGTFYGLVLQPDGWVERDVGTFGPRLIPPPPPFVSGPAVPPKLSNNNGGAAAPVPANDAAAPANDSLARFRPAGTPRTPY